MDEQIEAYILKRGIRIESDLPAKETKKLAPVTFCVLLPCHSNSPYLDKAITSVLEDIPITCKLYIVTHCNPQLYNKLMNQNLERNVIVLEDNASKNLAEVLNFGLSRITEEYVFRMDSDDVWCKNRFESQKKLVLTNPHLDVVGGAIDVIDQSANYLYSVKRNVDENFFKEELKYHCVIAHPAVLFKKKSVIECGGYNHRVYAAEDFDLWTRMRRKYNFSAVSEVVLHYRVHSQSMSKSKNNIQKQEVNHILARNFVTVFNFNFLFCRDFSHSFNSKISCRLVFLFFRLKRKLLISIAGQDFYLRTSFSKAFETLCTEDTAVI